MTDRYSSVTKIILDSDLPEASRSKVETFLDSLDASWELQSQRSAGVILALLGCSRDKQAAYSGLNGMRCVLRELERTILPAVQEGGKVDKDPTNGKINDQVKHTLVMKNHLNSLGIAIGGTLFILLPEMWMNSLDHLSKGMRVCSAKMSGEGAVYFRNLLIQMRMAKVQIGRAHV